MSMNRAAFSIKMLDEDKYKVLWTLAQIKGVTPLVLMRSMNNTMQGVRTDVSSEIRAIITTGKSDVDKSIGITKANKETLSGAVVISGRLLPLLDFGARQTQKGVSVQIRKDHKRAVLSGAFIATMKSGHKGVFWREYHKKGQRLGKTEQRISRSGYIFNTKTGRYFPARALPREYRLPIHELFGPRVPDYLGDEGPVMDTVLAKAEDRLDKNIEHELNYELSKL